MRVAQISFASSQKPMTKPKDEHKGGKEANTGKEKANGPVILPKPGSQKAPNV